MQKFKKELKCLEYPIGEKTLLLSNKLDTKQLFVNDLYGYNVVVIICRIRE